MMIDTADRTTHATSADCTVAVVRYNKQGKWRLERADGTKVDLGLATAVIEAILLERDGGRIITGRAGGTRFDAEVSKRRGSTHAWS